jgi:universal stress protein A
MQENLREDVRMIQNLKKILAPIDFSEYSFEAMRGAWELARDVGAELHLLHVVVPHHSYIPMFGAEQPAEAARETAMAEQAEEEMTRIKKDQMGNSGKVIILALVGNPIAKVAEYAAQNDIDLILLATHGRSGLEHILIGSVAEKLARVAPCSVMIMRRKRAAAS